MQKDKDEHPCWDDSSKTLEERYQNNQMEEPSWTNSKQMYGPTSKKEIWKH